MISNSLKAAPRGSYGALFGALIFFSGSIESLNAAGLSAKQPINAYATQDNVTRDEYAPAVASDGNGRLVSVWQESTYFTKYKTTLHSSFSVTSGTTWAAGIDIAVPGGSTVANADICYAGAGEWVTAFQTDSAPPQVMAVRSSDLGRTWTEAAALSTTGSVVNKATPIDLASDGQGNVMAVWIETTTGTQPNRVMMARSADFGASWAAPAQVASQSKVVETTPLKISARVAAAGNGSWYLVYASAIESPVAIGKIYMAKSTDAGASWTQLGPVEMHFHGGTTMDLEGANGKAVLAVFNPLELGRYIEAGPNSGYEVLTDGLELFVSDDSGTTFTGPQWVIAPNNGPGGGSMALAADNAGNWMLASHSPTTTAPVQVYKTSDLSTTWTLTHEAAVSRDSSIDVAAAGEGDFAVLADVLKVPATSIDTDRDIQAFATVDFGSTWVDQVKVNAGAGLDLPSVVDLDIDIASGENVVIAAWMAKTAYYPDPFSSIPTWQSQVMISRSLDHGATWGPAMALAGGFTSQYQATAGGSMVRVTYLGGQSFEVSWKADTALKSVSADDGLTWNTPTVGGATGSPLNSNVAVGFNNDQVRVRSETVAAGTNYTINTYTEYSTDNGNTWDGTALLHSETRAGFRYRNLHSGDPAIIYMGESRFAVLIRNTWLGRNDFLDVDHLLSTDLYLAESADNGRTWTVPQELVASHRAHTPAPLRSSGDRIIVAWPQFGDLSVPQIGNEGDIMSRTKVFGRTTAASDWQLFE